MIIVSIKGGIGNQMFQYVFAASIAKKFNLELKLDLSWFVSHPERKFMLDEFRNFNYTPSEEEDLAFLRSRLGSAINNLNLFMVDRSWKPIYRVYLREYYQGERFLKNDKPYIKDLFRFKSLQSERVQTVASLIREQPESVALHVRCGDYIKTYREQHYVCTPDYYMKAMEFIESKTLKPRYFVFSDDISFCKRFLKGRQLFFVEGVGSEIEELHLMTLCNHHILANSSFSWWGAWLAEKSKNVIAPYKWLNDKELNAEHMRNKMIPDGWHSLRF